MAHDEITHKKCAVRSPELPEGDAGSGKGGLALDWRSNQPSEPGLMVRGFSVGRFVSGDTSLAIRSGTLRIA
jgi:hypothetical protein